MCTKELGAKELVINENIKPKVLSSLSFHRENYYSTLLIYNYKYHEISETKVWYL